MKEKIEVNKIIHGNCIEVMRQFPNNCIDLIITDPPYGDNVAIFLWFEIPKVIVIKNKDLAKSYEKHFELMWKQAKP